MCEAGTLVSIEDAARMLETTEMRVLMMLKRKELEGRFEDETWYVEKASLQLCGKPEASGIVRPGGCGGGCGSGCGGH
jgi:hypothetical protein